MAFKEDWSFLDKITMGAVGTESVIAQLNACGHRVIELERYCTSNKIWATKIKRLRIPDLLCLRCGKRIESRAKSKLGIIMSDAENNPERRWFAGLRQSDLVAFIQCYKNEQDLWEASNTLNLFGVGDMLSTEDQTVLSAPKSVYEGAERDRTWASYTPGSDFTVTAIENEDAGTRIRLLNGAARNQSKLVNANQHIYVNIGDSFQAGAKIVSGIVPHTCDCGCTDTQYDFFEDLSSQQAETVYTAVKALGFLPVTDRATRELHSIATDENIDARIRLEAYASLLRLGEDLWESAYNYVFTQESKEIRMEFALILGELHSLDAENLLKRIVDIDTNESELRAASIWSLPNNAGALIPILMECFSTDSTVADHAIAKVEKNFSSDMTSAVLNIFGEDEQRNAICSHILSSSDSVDYPAVVRKYLSADNMNIRNWLLYTIGISGAEKYRTLINELDPQAESTTDKLVMLWDYSTKAISQSYSDAIVFIRKQK